MVFFSPVKFESLDHRHPLVNHSSLSISAAHTLHVAFAVFVCSDKQEGEAISHRGATELSVIVSFISPALQIHRGGLQNTLLHQT